MTSQRLYFLAQYDIIVTHEYGRQKQFKPLHMRSPIPRIPGVLQPDHLPTTLQYLLILPIFQIAFLEPHA